MTDASAASRDRIRQTMLLVRWYAGLLQDLHHAVRSLSRRPSLSLIAVATVAVGVGACTLVFSLVDGVLLKPLPFPQPDRLVNLYRIDPMVTGDNPTPAMLSDLYAVPMPVYRDWRELSRSFSSVGAYKGSAFTMTGGEAPERVIGYQLSSGVLQALAVGPLHGRSLVAGDDAVGAPAVALLSYRLWQGRFGGDPEVVGQSLVLDDVVHTIIGVMPAGFSFPDSQGQVWTSFSDGDKQSSTRNAGSLQVLARLEPGVSLSQARQDAAAVAAAIATTHPEEREHGIGVYSRQEIIVAPARTAVLLALAIGCLVLLIACANLAALLLVRVIERSREISVRAALGAGRSRLVVQLLTESLLLSLAGGALGALLAMAGVRPLLGALPVQLPRAAEITPDLRVLVFAVALSLLTGVLTGLLPALRAPAAAIATILRGTGRSLAGSVSRSRSQAALVVSQVALSFAVLACAALFTKSFARLVAADNGFDPNKLLSAEMAPPEAQTETWDDVLVFYDDLMDQLHSIPGVTEVAAANQLPFITGLSFPPVQIDTTAGLEEEIIHTASVTPSYPAAMEIPLLAGRSFTGDDREGGQPVALVNRSLADRFWPGEEAIGRRLRINAENEPAWYSVVGVVGDVHYAAGRECFPELFLPLAQRPRRSLTLVVRTAHDPASVIPQLREVLRSANPDHPLSIERYDEQIAASASVAAPRFGASALAAIAVVALLLAVLGIYGLLAFTVNQRIGEIGIRMVLGAGRRSILRSVVGRGLRLASIGLVLGTGLALLCFRALEGGLYGISPTDPLTMVEAGLLIVAAALAASSLPAWRAMRVDPVEALRRE